MLSAVRASIRAAGPVFGIGAGVAIVTVIHLTCGSPESIANLFLSLSPW